jgi:predicted dehydrogenase
MNKRPLRWGILGTANIARKNWKAIWNSGNGHVVAVASRDRERSKSFIEACQSEAPFASVPRALGSYEELIACDEVDALYLPLPTGIRGEWVRRAADAGKHVVCEKPCAVSVAELTELLAACRRNGVQFMDGVMFMHSARLPRIREILNDGKTVGPIRRITSAFSFRGSDEFFATNMRSLSGLEPHGCLGDLGWYCIRLALWAMEWRLPQRVCGRSLSEFHHPRSQSPVTTEFSAELFFEGGTTSSFYCSFLTENEQWAMLSGELGNLWVPDFVLPFSGAQVAFETGNAVFDVQGCDFEMQPGRRRWVVEECSHSHPTAQETKLFCNFAEAVASGSSNPLWPEMALKTQLVMEACQESGREQGRPVEVTLPSRD